MTSNAFTNDELQRYADVALGRCVDLRPGELLQINFEHEHRPLAVAVAEAAYRRGLRVDAVVRDPLIERAELTSAAADVLGSLAPWRRAIAFARTEEGMATLIIDGEGEPGALEGCDPERLARHARRRAEQLAEMYKRMEVGRDSFVIIAYPTAAWARRAYPELEPARAQRALAEDILSFARVGAADAPDALDRHIAMLGERARIANELGLRELRFRGPGTDLRVGLTADTLWGFAEETNAYGRTFVCNLPSEEIYTAPAASATEGTFRCTMPLTWRGRVFEELRAEFRGGRLVRLDARTDDQRDALASQLDVDEGGRRLGEVALVDASSRIGQRGRLYGETLLDENQSCHVAFGLGFATCRRRGQATEDLNASRTHIDVMIGSPEVEVTGTTAAGATVPIIVDGAWRPGADARTAP
jgi:aminopeptidase